MRGDGEHATLYDSKSEGAITHKYVQHCRTVIAAKIFSCHENDLDCCTRERRTQETVYRHFKRNVRQQTETFSREF